MFTAQPVIMNSCKNFKCLRNKVFKTLGHVRKFTYLGAANITSKQKTDMTKVAIKNVNIISFDGVFHIMDVFSKLGFEKLTESVLGKNVEVAAKHSVMEVFFVVFHTSPLVWVGDFMIMQEPRTPEAPHIDI